MISYGKQSINQEDINSVIDVLQSDFLTQGPIIEDFEKKVAQYCGVKYAVAVCNATAALHIACLAAGIGKGDIVWTVPNTFVASANCALYCGASVDFVDIDNNTYNMSLEELEKKLVNSERKPKIVIPVHFSGQPCEMAKLHFLADKYGFILIEDASHAIGAEYKNSKVGNCEYSDMVVFSFHPVKIITTGEGGMVLTNDENLYEKLLLFRSHGITRKSSLMENTPDGPWYYEQLALGFNYRMTELQAALGTSQMKRLDVFLEKRRALAKRYNDLLKNLPLKLPNQNEDTNSSWHLYVVRANFSKLNINKKMLFAKMQEKQVNLNLHYIPVHTQPYYKKLGFTKGDFPVSEKYYEEVFTLPLYYDLSYEQQDYIVDCLQSLFK